MVKLLFILLASLATAAAHAAGGNIRVEITDTKNQPVADAVASLLPLDAPPPLVPPAEPVVIVQDQEEFSPYVTAVVVGTRVSFPNRDKVQHHVYSLSKPKSFELPLYKDETHEPILFDQPGVVALGCNIHDWMSAYLVVLPTPHFAKTGADGLAPLATLPPGRYRLEVWHPRIAAVVTREVTVDPNDPGTQVIAVTLKPDRRIRRAPESASGSYR
ncbi:MAG TPA: carboxypeptidase regulatory-like domain-containing protein [Opitutus sp.]|nr:carboxypeptidase regulatory-like domain-containing protein [Opitutus sp.]